jgi:hypothetical protein
MQTGQTRLFLSLVKLAPPLYRRFSYRTARRNQARTRIVQLSFVRRAKAE